MEPPASDTKKGRARGPAGTRTFYKVDTNGTCLLCLRDHQQKSSKKLSRHVSSQFCKILFRYLKLDFFHNIVKPSNFKWKANRVKKIEIELCQDCTFLATAVKDMYCQLELIQMKLDAYVKNISDIMRTAGRIPSRVKGFQERLGIVPRDSGGGTIKPKAALLAENFRKELIQKTIDCHKRTFPKVVIRRQSTVLPKHKHSARRLITSSSVRSSKSTNATAIAVITAPLSPVQLQFRNFLLAYTLSFATVWLLVTSTERPFLPGPAPPAICNGMACKSAIGKIEDIPVFESQECSKPGWSYDIKDDNQVESKSIEARNSIMITNAGKTVLLPHQSIKMDAEFVDESIMEYEDTDLVDISDDGFFAQANSLINDINMSADPILIAQPEMVKQEPQESIMEVNDRTCKDCMIHLSCRAELEKHRALIHKLLNHVQCPVCRSMFASYHFLKEHRKASEACDLDEATEALEFTTIAKPLFPYSSTVRGNRFCPMEGCFEVFLKPENLQLHLKAHGLFYCSQETCKEKFDKAHDLALHECQQHSSGQFTGYKCIRCNFHVGGQYKYLLHFLGQHLKIDVFSEQCSICRKGFLSKGPLLTRDKEIHFAMYHDIEGKDPKSIFKCDIDNCEAFFLKKAQLTVHKVSIHHIEQETKWSCSICGEGMLNQLILKKHKLQAHSNLSTHEIEAKMKAKARISRKGKYHCHCGNLYSTKYALLMHGKVHDHLKKSVVLEGNALEDRADETGRDEESQDNSNTSQDSMEVEVQSTEEPIGRTPF